MSKTKRPLKFAIKNWLLAHHGNDHLPHLLRARGLALGMALILVTQVAFNFAATGRFLVLGYATNINQTDLLNMTNQERAGAGVAALRLNAKLNNAAHAKANDMFAKNYWAHTSPDGTEPWHFINQAGYTFTHAGENLAKDFDTSSGVIAGWMGSGSHRQNMLSSAYRDVGFAVVNGTLQGKQTTIVVAFYATPAASSPPPPPPQPVQAAPAPVAEPVHTPAPEPTPAPPPPEPEPEPEPAEQEKVEAVPFDITTLQTEKNYSIANPLPVSKTIPSSKKSTAFILSGFLFVNTMNHTVIWRKRNTRLNRAKHIWFRTHPAIQATILALLIIAMLYSGLGTVL